jgi:hypothetical protein
VGKELHVQAMKSVILCVRVCVCKDFYVIYSILLQVCMVVMSVARLYMAVKVIYTCGRVLGSDLNYHPRSCFCNNKSKV